MKLLLISNSFGVNLQKYAKEIAKANGIDLQIYTLYIGGCPLELHDKNIKENNKAYELFVDGSSTGEFVSINEMLIRDKWDYISLQQASHLSGDISSYYPYLNNVYTYVKKICPKSKIMWHKTWPYSRNNPFKFNEVKTWCPTFKFKDGVEMAAAIDECVAKINDEFKFDLVVDSGKTVFEDKLELGDVYDSEGFHLNNLGCYLIGLNLIKTLKNKPVKKLFKTDDLDEEICKKSLDFVNRYFNNLKKVETRGRFLKNGEFLKFFNIGSGINFWAKGKSVTFAVKMLDNDGYYYVIQDFDYAHKKKYFLEKNKTIYSAFFLQDKKPHHFAIVKANESMNNSFEVGLLDTDGKIIRRKKPVKFIKVYGDSTIAGYGILAHSGEGNIHNCDGVEDFCFRALFSLGFDYDIFAASGWGLAFSAYTNPKEIGIEKYTENLCVCSKKKWASKPADLLIISLGTNDQAYIDENPEKTQEFQGIFINSYKKILLKEYQKTTNLPVIMVYGSLIERHVYELVEKTYQELSKEFKNIHLLKLSGDNTAISNHSFVTAHEKMVEELKKTIIEVLQ